ncbi:hypothetical protein QJQ45_024696 [Haematococcus lacustris]|nr:hypothetical protein QJQ45_024696 [Haematococcus lacustris]
MPDSETFWITAGQASAVVGGMFGATVIGASLLRQAISREDGWLRARVLLPSIRILFLTSCLCLLKHRRHLRRRDHLAQADPDYLEWEEEQRQAEMMRASMPGDGSAGQESAASGSEASGRGRTRLRPEDVLGTTPAQTKEREQQKIGQDQS